MRGKYGGFSPYKYDRNICQIVVAYILFPPPPFLIENRLFDMRKDSIIKTVIADNHELFRDGFKLLLDSQQSKEIELVAEARDGAELLDHVKKYQPDIVLTDLLLPKIDGLQASTIINARYPRTGIIALTMQDEEHTIIDVLRAGASGYILKNTPKQELILAIKEVAGGNPYYCQSISGKLFHVLNEIDGRKRTKKIDFSPQEIRVMKLICKQMTTKEIAQQLRLCARTVEDYRHNIQEKICARNVVGIALYAIEHRIVTTRELANF
jgi:DNA-binding NarL/FixJ family response regulator